MKLNVHLNFQGNCAAAFAFYAKLFGAKNPFMMKYADAPHGMPVPPDWKDKVMHTSIPLGDGTLMGCDAPPGSSTPIGGFQISVESEDEAEVKRIYEALKQDGTVQMPLAPTFWSPCSACARTSSAWGGWSNAGSRAIIKWVAQVSLLRPGVFT